MFCSRIPFGDRPAAVDFQYLPRDETRLIREEKDHRSVQIVGPADAPAIQRLLGLYEALDPGIARSPLRHRRLDQRRKQSVGSKVWAV